MSLRDSLFPFCRDKIQRMTRVWSLRHRLGWRPALLLIWILCAGFAGAQEPPKSQPHPAPRLILLPSRLVAGAQATLAVLDSQGRLLPNISVELSGGQKVATNATGRALFRVPSGVSTMTAKIPGREITASAPVSAAAEASAPGDSQSAATAIKVVSYPRVLAIHDRFTVEGAGLRGAADSDRVFLGDQPCLVLAASPASLVVLPGPHVPIGGVRLRIQVDGREASQLPVSVALLEFSGPAEAPSAGASGKLVLRARGTTERLIVEIRNGSPDVIQLPKGNVQRITTSGGDENSAPLEVKYLASGNYVVTARLISTELQQSN